jgi:hypothetical protein
MTEILPLKDDAIVIQAIVDVDAGRPSSESVRLAVKLGRQYGPPLLGMPTELARYLGAEIVSVPGFMLRRRESVVLGRISRKAGRFRIELADDLRGRTRLEVLAHECGHVLLIAELGWNTSDEELGCNVFALEFLDSWMADKPQMLRLQSIHDDSERRSAAETGSRPIYRHSSTTTTRGILQIGGVR